MKFKSAFHIGHFAGPKNVLLVQKSVGFESESLHELEILATVDSRGSEHVVGDGRVCPALEGALAVVAQHTASAREAEYRAEGWTSAPVCTPTFKLMLRDGDLAAVLAEDLPDGVAVTELVRRGVL